MHHADLDEDPAVIRRGHVERALQLFAVLRAGNADGRTERRRFDERRVLDLLLDALDDGLTLLLELLAGEPYKIQHREASAAQNLLHRDLIHADGRAQHAGGRIRDVRHLQQTLNRAILAVPAVEHGDHAVDMAQRRRHLGKQPRALRRPCPQVARVRRHIQRYAGDSLGHRVKLAEGFNVFQRLARVPQAIAGDIHRRHVKASRLRRLDALQRGNDRHVMLAAAGTKEHRNIHFTHSLHAPHSL